jgi:hypothetical protein
VRRFATFSFLLLIPPLDFSAVPGEEPAGKPKTAAQAYKNVQVLKDLPASEWGGVMSFFAASLGVNCNHCHVEGETPETWPWESDANENKKAARKMIELTRRINETWYGGRLEVTCATCHAGTPRPSTAPPVDQVALRLLHAKGIDLPQGTPVPLPAIDQVLEKYERALGGAEAIAKWKSDIVSATLMRGDGSVVEVQIYRRAPGKRLVIIGQGDRKSSEGFDGKTGWTAGPRGVRTVEEGLLPQMRRNADFFRHVKLKEQFSSIRMAGREKLPNREVVVLEAKAAVGGFERLSFDIETGLLVRRYTETKTAMGPIGEEFLFDDYRSVDGIEIPFTVRRTAQWQKSVQTVKEARINVPIEDSMFSAPAAPNRPGS